MEERKQRTHCLKTWPRYFNDIKTGLKTFELRRNDRDYQVGDILKLREWDQTAQDYTGEIIKKEITYILEGGNFGLATGFCIMSIK